MWLDFLLVKICLQLRVVRYFISLQLRVVIYLICLQLRAVRYLICLQLRAVRYLICLQLRAVRYLICLHSGLSGTWFVVVSSCSFILLRIPSRVAKFSNSSPSSLNILRFELPLHAWGGGGVLNPKIQKKSFTIPQRTFLFC